MRLFGSYEFDAPAAKVWAALTDPKSLSGCIQGCESLDSVGENQYTAVMNVGVDPIRGKYNANVAMANLSPHQSFRLSVQGEGATGFVDGSGDEAGLQAPEAAHAPLRVGELADEFEFERVGGLDIGFEGRELLV